jgi:predicted phosphodiesterase
MKILHLSDLHFNEKNFHLSLQIFDELLKELSNIEIDFVVFSGDLVTAPTGPKNFEMAKELFIAPILSKLKLNIDSFIICEGNHDVQRGCELPMITEYLTKLKSNEDIENYISQGTKQFELSLENHLLYYNFLKDLNKENQQDIVNELYTIHKRKYQDRKINFATLNSAWRSVSSTTDSSNLLYPNSKLKEAIKHLDAGSFRILVMHHPLKEFKDFVSREMEDLIYENFDIMITGHNHKKNYSVHFHKEVGILCSCAQAVFTKNKDGIEIGFNILDLNDQNEHFSEFSIRNYSYSLGEQKFVMQRDILGNIPIGLEKEAQNKLRKTITKRYGETFSIANDLLVFSNDEGRTFIDLFVDPIIKNKPKTNIKQDSKNYGLAFLENSDQNFLIFGKDKFGKTSLLYKIYLDILSNFTVNKTIPIFIDFRSLNPSSLNFNPFKNLSIFCETNQNNILTILQQYKIKLLIDNYSSDNSKFNDEILALIEKCNNISIIGTVEETLLSGYKNHSINNHTFENLFIHEIGRKEIRQLTNKLNLVEEYLQDEAIDRIQKVFNQLNFPFNYWNVMLFLFIYNKTKESTFHNNFELIQLYIDELLERKQHVTDKSIKISFDELKEYLSFLAHHLVKNLIEYSHSIEFKELVSITDDYIKRHNRLVISTSDLIKLIIERKIFKKLDSNRFTFRLNGVFEFFIAYFMKDNKEFAFELIEDDYHYFSFCNEFELFSGFNKKDKAFVESIFVKTKRIFKDTISTFQSQGSIDNNLSSRIIDIEKVTRGLKIVANKNNLFLNSNDKDELLGELTPVNKSTEEVKQKSFIPKIENSSEHLEKALFILCRVFRNSNINDNKFDREVIDYILDAACNLGFLLIDETKGIAIEDDLITNDEKTFIKLIMEIMPIVVQSFLYDSLAQKNLERLLLEKLNELKLKPKENQFKLFLVYFILIDLDFNNKKNLIPELIEVIKLGVLRHSNLLKLYLYLAFNGNGRKEIEKEIQKHIRNQEGLLNSNGKIDNEKHVNQKIEGIKTFGRIQRKK